MEELRGRLAEQGLYSKGNCFDLRIHQLIFIRRELNSSGDFALQVPDSVAINSVSSLACGSILSLSSSCLGW